MRTVRGNPYVKAGAERAPCTANSRAALSSSSPVVTPGRTCFVKVARVSRATRAYPFTPLQAKVDSIDIGSGEHRVVPVANDERLHEPFQNKRVLLDEGFGGHAGSEDCHVATVGERADSDDVAFCDERIHDGLVPWIHRHDLFHRGAGGFADHD